MNEEKVYVNGYMGPQDETDGRGTLLFPVSFLPYLFAPNTVLNIHWHEEFQTGIALADGLSMAVGNRIITLNEGDGYFLNSQVLHAFANLTAAEIPADFIVFHPDYISGGKNTVLYEKYIKPLCQNTSLSCVIFRRGRDDETLQSVRSACEAMRKQERGYEFTVRDCLSAVTYTAASGIDLSAEGMSGKLIRNEERMKKMLEYIRQNYQSQISLEDIAKKAGISKSECIRCFRETVRTTPVQFLKQYRLARAAELLEHTDLPVGETGFHCGFEDPNYFIRSFRQEFGITPLKYRKSRTDRRNTDGKEI